MGRGEPTASDLARPLTFVQTVSDVYNVAMEARTFVVADVEVSTVRTVFGDLAPGMAVVDTWEDQGLANSGRPWSEVFPNKVLTVRTVEVGAEPWDRVVTFSNNCEHEGSAARAFSWVVQGGCLADSRGRSHNEKMTDDEMARLLTVPTHQVSCPLRTLRGERLPGDPVESISLEGDVVTYRQVWTWRDVWAWVRR